MAAGLGRRKEIRNNYKEMVVNLKQKRHEASDVYTFSPF